jgi:hypothetical protein
VAMEAGLHWRVGSEMDWVVRQPLKIIFEPFARVTKHINKTL